jgi:sulfhydrogenase subunit beta (sulfur reductase)
MTDSLVVGGTATISPASLQLLLDTLIARDFEVVGPTTRDGAIVYDRIRRVADLPIGWTDRQDAGRYRLERRDDSALFGYNVGPQAWKRFLHRPVETLWTARKDQNGTTIEQGNSAAPKYAFIGVRACELHAIAIQDRVFMQGPYADQPYAARRQNAFFVAVNCGQAGGTCFCVSMQSGPKAESGFDLALTELLDDSQHEFLVEIGSAAGAEVLEQIPHRAATDDERTRAATVVAQTREQMGRRLYCDRVVRLFPLWHCGRSDLRQTLLSQSGPADQNASRLWNLLHWLRGAADRGCYLWSLRRPHWPLRCSRRIIPDMPSRSTSLPALLSAW